MEAKWNFKEHQRGDTTINPLGGEHFSDSDDDWKPGESLVRECIQNSLDAAFDDDERVVVNFRVSPANAMTIEAATFWFGSLWSHLRDEKSKIRNLDRMPKTGGFIVIEDFGTKGLEGDVEQSGLSIRGNENRFFNFFRAEGLTGNAADDTSGGSWGVGKTVFNRCSKINSFLALSTRRSSLDTVLMGKAVLNEHFISGTQYKAFGLYGCHDAEYEQFILPSEDKELFARFVREFRIARLLDAEESGNPSGLSIVIPYADPDITADGIVEIVIRQYFHPILADRLAVRVSDGRSGHPPVDINASTIIDLAEQREKPEILQFLQLSRWSLGLDAREQTYVLDEPPSGKPPLWDEALLRPDDPQFADLCKRFEDGDQVAIRIPMRVYPKDDQPERTSLTVYLQRDLVGSGYRPVFVRGKIVVPNARERSIRGHQVFSLVTIEDGPLAILLRAAEPPAHTHWDSKTANFKGRYEYGRQVIELVVQAPKNLANALSSSDMEPDFDIWADLFPAPDPEGKRKDRGKKRKGKRKTPTEPIDPPKSSPVSYRVDELPEGGFAIMRANADHTELPQRIRVDLGYATSKGNPIKKHHVSDFDLQKMQPETHACTIVECTKNMLRFEPESDDFRLELTGFDPNRDLCVKPRKEDRPEGNDA
jgi:hypothetical protein